MPWEFEETSKHVTWNWSISIELIGDAGSSRPTSNIWNWPDVETQTRRDV